MTAKKKDKPNKLNESLIRVFNESMTKVKPIIVGDVILVGRLPKQDLKTKGGIVLTRGGVQQINAFDSNLPQFVQVLAIGQGFYDGEKNVPLDLKPGNIIEVAAHSVSWFSSFGIVPDSQDSGTGIGMTREAEYRMKFKDYKAYQTFMAPFYDIEFQGV